MTDQRTRLSNRILTCQDELKLAEIRLKSNLADRKFWLNELMAAEAEFHGFKQGDLNLIYPVKDAESKK